MDLDDKRQYNEHAQAVDGEAQLQTLVDNAPVVLSALDDDGVVLLSEGRGLDALGLEPGELVGDSVFDRYGDAPTVVRNARRALAGDSFTATEEVEGVSFESIYRPVFGQRGTVEWVARVSVDVTDRRQYEETLAALHGSTLALVDAETKSEVAERIVDAATDVLDLTGVVLFLFDETTNCLEPVAASPDVEPFVGEPPTYRPGSSITWHVFVEGESRVYGDVRESDLVDNPDTRVRSGLYIPLGSHGVLVAISAERDAFEEETIDLVTLFATNAEVALDRVDYEEMLRTRDDELQTQNDQLTRLNELNGTIRELVQRLIRADTREEIERAVCERLTTVDRYGLAWVGDADVVREELVPRTWAGGDHSYLDSVDRSLTPEGGSTEPACVAAATRELVAVDNVAEGLRDDPWRQEALSRDYQSVLAVPLVYEGFLYGVLTVYAARLNAFDETTAAVLRELGETIGYAINTVETRRGVLTDGTLELDIQLAETDDLLARVARSVPCRLSLEGIVPETDTAVLFVTVTDADVEEVRAAFEELVSVSAVRVVAEHDDEGLLEVVTVGETLPGTLTRHGAVPKSVTTTDDGLRALVHVAYDTDVRAFLAMLREKYPDVELVARRDRERSLDPGQGFAAELERRLTDRQAEVLKTAYCGGFFESPRESTGEELGASLGITQPTFNHHLRAGQRKLFDLLYDGETGSLDE